LNNNNKNLIQTEEEVLRDYFEFKKTKVKFKMKKEKVKKNKPKKEKIVFKNYSAYLKSDQYKNKIKRKIKRQKKLLNKRNKKNTSILIKTLLSQPSKIEFKEIENADKLYVDGGCSNNGQLNYFLRDMVIVVTDNKGTVISEENENGGGSNNIAEIWAVKNALRYCLDKNIKKVNIYTDSENNIKWLKSYKVGEKVNNRELVISLLNEILEMRKSVLVQFLWVRREVNLAGHYIEKKYKL